MIASSKRQFWMLWMLVNTLAIGVSFGLASFFRYLGFSSSARGSANLLIGFLLLPIDDPKTIILIDIALCLVQYPFLRQFQWGRVSIRWILLLWILTSFFRFYVISYVRSFSYLVGFALIPKNSEDIQLEYVVGAVSGAISGLIGGGITGLLQICAMPIRKYWAAISAVAWATAGAMGWIIMRYVSWSLYSGSDFLPAWVEIFREKQQFTYGMPMQPEGFVLDLPYKLAIYGGVIGLVSSAITGIGLLTCFPRRDRTSL
jgi:hypothetical protein